MPHSRLGWRLKLKVLTADFALSRLAAKRLNLADRSDHKARRPVEEHPSVKRAFRHSTARNGNPKAM